ncbi:hypothetical protein BJY52DRAFT_1381630 [Lactarius psammicola]|nr:hypothetical protein BJY52DRAFT_1381630 [Lactarius psammicola]
MGGCCSKPTVDDTPPVATREVAPQGQSPPVIPRGVGASGPSSQQSGTKPGRESPKMGRVLLPEVPARNRVNSDPQKVQSRKDSENSPLPPQMSRAKSSAFPSSRGTGSLMSADHSRASPIQPTMSYPARRPLSSTVRQVLPEHLKCDLRHYLVPHNSYVLRRFRILVIGKSGSGKSSLIKAAFKVDVTAAPKRALGKADINVEFRPGDNRYLVVHECSGLDYQTSNSQDLQTIRDFISHRTDPNCTPSERLHAVWICVPASDAIAGRLGDGVEDILGLRNVPVVVVFTKFDVVVSQVRLDSPSGEPQRHERARARAQRMYEDSCRRLFHKDPRDVPAEIVSENSRFVDLLDNLIVTTDKFITDSRAPSARSGVHGAVQRVGAVPLGWSAALRVNHDIIIQASIEVGRSRYWRNLWSSLDFADQTLKNCVNIIHVDIVEVWNLNDRTRYLSSDKFKAKMSHLVKDLAGSTDATSGSEPTRAGDNYADWVHDMYSGSQENVRCVMGYIVDLTVILDGIFRMAADDMSPNHAQQIFERHARSRHRDAIHNDIRSFITEAFTIRFSVPQKDLVLEKIIDLIKQFCVPPSRNG